MPYRFHQGIWSGLDDPNDVGKIYRSDPTNSAHADFDALFLPAADHQKETRFSLGSLPTDVANSVLELESSAGFRLWLTPEASGVES